MSVTTIEDTRELGALTAPIGNVVQMGRVFKFLPDVRIGKSTDHVLAIEKSAEDLSFIACEWIESLCGPLWSHLLTGRDAIQSADRVVGSSTSARAAR